MNISQERVSTFDKSVSSSQKIILPDSYARLFKSLDNLKDTKIIPQGAGLSYAPASMIQSGVVINTQQFNRILDFDTKIGLVKCEAGTSIGKLQSQCLKYGWYLPTLPGYPSITIGGCVAFNIHGKSQYHTGNFIECVHSLRLFHPTYGEIECSRTQEAEIFFLTVGGMGFTGFITEICLQLKVANFSSFYVEKVSIPNVFDAITYLEQEAHNWDALYSWHNFMKVGKQFGKGIIYCERFEQQDKAQPELKKLMTSKRKTFPINVLNYWTTPIMNFVYEKKEQLKKSVYITDLISGSFPIYGKEIYFSLYGKKGFLEYQLIIPKKDTIDTFLAIQSYIEKHKQPIGLASLKLFKGKQSYLNFCEAGICLALDVPNNNQGRQFFDFLDTISKNIGGLMNISKDSRLSADPVASVYKEYDLFKEKLLAYDKKKIFTSYVREQLNL